jgi:hypothetical protein
MQGLIKLFVLMTNAGPNQIQNLKEIGPAAYSFSTRPKLDSPVSDKQEIEDIVVGPRWQKVFFYFPICPDLVLSISVLCFSCFVSQHLKRQISLSGAFPGAHVDFLFSFCSGLCTGSIRARILSYRAT